MRARRLLIGSGFAFGSVALTTALIVGVAAARQTAFRLKASLLFRPNTVVIDVPDHAEVASGISRP